MDILEFFPKHLIPRKEQIYALRQVELAWNDFDVFVLNLPVSVGKSAIAITISRWQEHYRKRTSILTPSNILVNQYLEDYPHLHTIKRRTTYSCHSLLNESSCADFFSNKKFYCRGCPYKKDVAGNSWQPTSVVNYYTYLAYKMFRDVVIVDEAHQLRGIVADQMSHKLWKSKYKYPFNINTYYGLKQWVDNHRNNDTDKVLKLLKKELSMSSPKYLVEKTTDLLRGKQEEVLKVAPVDTSNYSGIMWPSSKVKKLVLMSATISKTDIEQLGLSKKRVITIESRSPIPKERRPVYFNNSAAITLSIRSTEQDLANLASQIIGIVNSHPNQKGFIHITYSLMERIKPFLEFNNRLIFHTRENKLHKYQQYRENREDAVLVACGLYEGVDLLEDMGRFQIITKVPWPSLGEPAIKWQAEVNASYYAWEAIKVVIQATGRICRSPTDFGKTYILDRSFGRLYEQNESQFPSWFKEGMIWEV